MKLGSNLLPSRIISTMACFLCPERRVLESELGRLRRWSQDPTSRPAVDRLFSKRVVCQVVNPHGRVPYTVEAAELRYKQDFPAWDKGLVRMPPGVLYMDKLQVYERAQDLEQEYLHKAMSGGVRGSYINRIGSMGESVAVEAVADLLKGRQAFIINGFKFR